MRVDLAGIGSDPEPVTFRFGGQDVVGRRTDSLASALINAGLLECRVTHGGDVRGVFCGMGACSECAVVVDGRAGQLACMTPVSNGMCVDRQPPAPRIEPSATEPLPEIELAPDVLVVGGGPAGLSAATITAGAGLSTLIVDERSNLGGQYFKQPASGARLDEPRLDDQYREGRQLIREAESAGAESLLGVRIWGAFAPTHLTAVGSSLRYTIRPKRLILSPGAHERGVPMPGWTLPGVMTTGAAQTLMRSNQVAPGTRVLVSGNGPLNLQLAADMARAGVEVVAMADTADLRWWKGLRPGVGMALTAPSIVLRGLGYRATLVRRGVPVLPKSSVVSLSGGAGVERATVARLDDSGRVVVGTERSFDVDAVCVGFGFLPSNEISRALGCGHRFDDVRGSLIVEASETGRTSVPGVWVIGDAGAIAGAQVAMAVGALAGMDVAADLGGGPVSGTESAQRSLRRNARFQSHLWRLYEAPVLTSQLADDDTIVCRCESVPMGSLRSALSSGAASAGALKRMTRAGMGKCQGRYCGPVLSALAASESGRHIDEFSGFAPQPPIRPTELSSIASNPA